jgi:L-ascorbate oxidase
MSASKLSPLATVKNCDATPYSYDDDIILYLGDPYSKTDAKITIGLLASPFIWSGETNALLVNGRSGRAGSENATDTFRLPHATIVDPGKTYRLLFIGSTAISLVTLGIEGHPDLTIIEPGGGDTQLFSTDHAQIVSSQRFSILLQTKTLAEVEAEKQTYSESNAGTATDLQMSPAMQYFRTTHMMA